MSAEVYFVDTSVLTNLLDIPHRNQDRVAASVLFKQRVLAGTTLVIPAAAVIETGNFIAQIDDGAVRRDRAGRLARFLTDSIEGRAPWAISAAEWSTGFVRLLVDGDGVVPALEDLAGQRVGAGDASILRERAEYRSRVPSGLNVHIWTLDSGLAAWS